jgi:molybdopterin-guanine dinucleotide biosynthesis protein A
MGNPYREITCYVLAGGKRNQTEDFQPQGDLTKLENSYRQYARVFEKVLLVLKKSQAREHYLNYPHVCDQQPDWNIVNGVETALDSSDSDTMFIGSSEITDFPPELIVELVKSYQGESFLGYSSRNDVSCQPLFGIYSKRLVEKLRALHTTDRSVLCQVIKEEGRLIPLPENIGGERIGLR